MFFYICIFICPTTKEKWLCDVLVFTPDVITDSFGELTLLWFDFYEQINAPLFMFYCTVINTVLSVFSVWTANNAQNILFFSLFFSVSSNY